MPRASAPLWSAGTQTAGARSGKVWRATLQNSTCRFNRCVSGGKLPFCLSYWSWASVMTMIPQKNWKTLHSTEETLVFCPFRDTLLCFVASLTSAKKKKIHIRVSTLCSHQWCHFFTPQEMAIKKRLIRDNCSYKRIFTFISDYMQVWFEDSKESFRRPPGISNELFSFSVYMLIFIILD